MLTSLSIKNYALIDSLHVEFDKGLTIITGETGAGKSILLGGLSLVLGKRADLSSLKRKDEKCIIEAEFSIEDYQLQFFFEENDIDYESATIIRREILPSGKSRAFINDTPVNLSIVSSLGECLIDIHSQHQTLTLTENNFQFNVIDAIAQNTSLLADYKGKLKLYLKAKKELQQLLDYKIDAQKEEDYNAFLLKELQDAKLEAGTIENLETIYDRLSNVETIKEKLVIAHQLLNDEKLGILNQLNELKLALAKTNDYGDTFRNLYERVNSVFIELDDLGTELINENDLLEADPQLLEETNTKLQLLYNLQKKHNVNTVEELIEIRDALEKKVISTENLETNIKELQLKILSAEKELDEVSLQIHENRKKIIPDLTTYLEDSLGDLGMPNARFKIEINSGATYLANGKDELNFLFAANKGTAFGELKKVASGGELSRIMLTIKAILARYMKLPTIMFDEIDTGVSGEISNKMGDIMREMSRHMQVFTITHLPQIAAKGDQHYKVYKEDINNITITNMRQLNANDRITEIAEMLGGKAISDSALAHAKQLLN